MATHPSKALLRINHLLAETDAVYHQMFSRMGLADSTMHILYTLLNAGGQCPLKVIRQLTGLPKQTLHSAISKLEEEGHILLLTEGRAKSAQLTESGLVLAEATRWEDHRRRGPCVCHLDPRRTGRLPDIDGAVSG